MFYRKHKCTDENTRVASCAEVVAGLFIVTTSTTTTTTTTTTITSTICLMINF